MEFVEVRARRLLATQLIEDAQGVGRRTENAGENKRVAMDRAFTDLIESDLLTVKHKFNVSSLADVLCTPGTDVGENIYRPSLKQLHAKLGVGEVAGYKAKPTWYSPAPANLAVAYAEADLYAYCKATCGLDFAYLAWQSCFARGSCLLLRCKTEPPIGLCSTSSDWCFSLGDVSSVAGLVWPARKIEINGVTGFVPEDKLKTAQLSVRDMWAFFVQLDTWEAMEYECVTPLAQFSLKTCTLKDCYTHML